MARRIENMIAFQLGWFGCVSSAANGLPLLGLLIAILVAALHVARSDNPLGELKLIAIAVALGTVADSLLLATGWLGYSTGQPLPAVAPYWIVAMWAMFATTLNESLAWLRRSLLLASASGAIFAPIAYWAGARLGAIELVDPYAALIAIGALWAIALPALTQLAQRLSPSRPARDTVGSNGRLENHA